MKIRMIAFGMAMGCLLASIQPVVAFDLDSCQSRIQASEQDYKTQIYTECGFDDSETAINYWAPLAIKKGWKTALYEIYQRHKASVSSSKNYLYESAKLGHAPALILVGDELFDQGKIPEAMKYYSVAVRGNIDEATKGRITGRLALLYANPSSSYHDDKKALPLLKNAALKRDALSNNLLGIFSSLGINGMPANAEESFRYFWRAILLGCPAAEENLGFFLLLKNRKADKATIQQEFFKRAYSCESVSETKVNYPLYHLTFTPQQCADINYYASRLVDTSLPFTGKSECAFSSDMENMADFLSK